MEGYRVLEWPPPAGERQPLVPDQFNMVTTLVDRHLHQGHGERVAVYYPAGQLTYAELASLVNRTGNLLGRLGVAIEERVALLLPDSPQFLATFLGAMKIGAVPVPLNLLATADDLHYYLSDSRARVVVLDADCLDRLRAVRARLPALRHVLLVGPPQPDALPFDELVARESDALEAAATSADDMAYWLYSSGTTGRPKGVVHLHRDMVYCTSAYAEQVVRLTPDDRSFSASKLFFS
ncbi:MAG TPA: AMP-binding protein, partial [Chloroflexota bacterium]|nr:AMP-binding protein [Chloroflexota bacterium]